MTPTAMRREIAEIPDAAARLLDRGAPAIREAAAGIAKLDPRVIVTVARGSSDHACTYLKYAAEILLGLPVASVGPSVASVYGASLRLDRGLCLAVSQSGQSPDIVAMTRAAGEGGAMTLAVTNDAGSRLAAAADVVLDLHAGPELSVVATKSFVNSVLAGLWLLAETAGDAALLRAIAALPERLAEATALDWSAAAGPLTAAAPYTLGRGPAWAISNEAALKLKETCLIHGESYSSAEVLHGPVSIVGEGFPVLAFAAADAAEAGVAEVADELASKGATVFATTPKVRKATALPAARTGHPLTDPLALIVTFYGLIEGMAVSMGIDPDQPRHLKKVTETT
ncbi:SIS domain-containing protein [Rhodobacterales bacterium HKCCE2091]|nr:SIS domain-containing protein [Rhodobacterales bacterium HKCCE2091]